MENSSKNHDKLYILILVIAIVIIGGICTYFIMNGIKSLSNENATPVIGSNTNKTTTTGVSFKNCRKESCSYNLKMENTITKVIYTNKDKEQVLKINEKEVFNESKECTNPTYMNTLQDVIIIQYNKGCTIVESGIIAYTQEGKEIFNYHFLDENYPDSMAINPEEKIEINVDNIVLSATRMTKENKLIININNKIEKVEVCSQTGIKNDSIVQAKYKITYQGNKVFSKPIMTESTKLKEFISRNCT